MIIKITIIAAVATAVMSTAAIPLVATQSQAGHYYGHNVYQPRHHYKPKRRHYQPRRHHYRQHRQHCRWQRYGKWYDGYQWHWKQRWVCG